MEWGVSWVVITYKAFFVRVRIIEATSFCRSRGVRYQQLHMVPQINDTFISSMLLSMGV